MCRAIIQCGPSDAPVSCISWSLHYITALISLSGTILSPNQAAGLWDLQPSCGGGVGRVWKSPNKDPLERWVQGQNLQSDGSILERVRFSSSLGNSLPDYSEIKFSHQILSDGHFLVN